MVYASYDYTRANTPGPPPPKYTGNDTRDLRCARARIARSPSLSAPICEQRFTRAMMHASYDCVVLALLNMRAMMHVIFDAREL